jgi:hypothetical protein
MPMILSWANPQTGQVESIYDYRNFRREARSVGREARKALTRRFGLDVAHSLEIRIRQAPERPGPLVQQFHAHSLCWAWSTSGHSSPPGIRWIEVGETVRVLFSRFKSTIVRRRTWLVLRGAVISAIALPINLVSRTRRESDLSEGA